MAVSIVIDITLNSQNIQSNTSNITFKVNAKWTGGSYNLLEKPGSLTVDGTKYTFNHAFNTGKTTSGSCNLFTKTLVIAHDSDGAKTIACSASYTSGVSSGTVGASCSYVVKSIPRRSTLSVANGKLGTAQTLTVTQQTSSFTHTISYTCGSASGTICTKSSSTSISFTPPLTLASQAPAASSVTIKYAITTYNGSTKVGDAITYSKTCSIPATVKPSCTISVSDPTGYSSNYGYLKGLSKFKITVSTTSAYGSPIVSYSISANGSKYTTSSATTDVLKQTGDVGITVTVTDKRGRSGTATHYEWVVDYSPPVISDFSIQRCNSDGTLNDKGAYIKTTFSANVTDLSDLNGAVYTIEYGKSSAGYTSSQKLTGYTNTYSVTNGTYIFAAETTSSYKVRLTAADNFSSVQQAGSVSTASKFMSWRAGGTGIAFGKEAEEENAAEFGFIMRSTHGELISSPMELPEGTHLDDVITEGHYTIGNVTLSATIQGKPLWYDGTTSTASIYVTRAGDGAQIIQRYYPCVKAEQFEISRMKYSGTWSEWMITGGCTNWKTLSGISDDFEAYSSGSWPKYRVNGNLVTVTGAVKPTVTITSNTSQVEFAYGIAAQYCPALTQTYVCQGSGINRWVLSINASGYLTVSRYGTDAYVNIPSGAWLPFTVTYSI